jgi:phage terminase large subunit-like protein
VPAERTASWPPRWLSPTTEATRALDYIEFVEEACSITKDSVAGRTGEPLKLRGWQKRLIEGLFSERDDGRLKHRSALIGMPRKNGKSALGSSLALASLYLGPDGGEVYSCAGDRDQARIVFGMAKRMVELNPDLSDVFKLYRDSIVYPATGSIYRVLSSEAYTKEGLNPSFVLFDEVHVQPNDEFWNVMALAAGARVEPLMVGITTAGVRTDTLGNDTLCYRLYQHGRRVATGEVEDPSFFFAWWEPEAGTEADYRDEGVWAECNPGFDDIVAAEDFKSSLPPRILESEFRTKRTNVWVTAKEAAIPHGVWEKLADPTRTVADGEPITLFFDGAWNGDCTAVVGCTDDRHLFELGLWERPNDDPHWHVPVLEVEEHVKALCRRYQVLALACDPYRWQRSMAVWEAEGLPVKEFPTNSPARMVPAFKQFYEAVIDATLTHDGSLAMARHVDNMVLKTDHLGARPVKDRSSNRHIDLAICAIGALHVLTFHEPAAELAVW